MIPLQTLTDEDLRSMVDAMERCRMRSRGQNLEMLTVHLGCKDQSGMELYPLYNQYTLATQKASGYLNKKQGSGKSTGETVRTGRKSRKKAEEEQREAVQETEKSARRGRNSKDARSSNGLPGSGAGKKQTENWRNERGNILRAVVGGTALEQKIEDV